MSKNQKWTCPVCDNTIERLEGQTDEDWEKCCIPCEEDREY